MDQPGQTNAVHDTHQPRIVGKRYRWLAVLLSFLAGPVGHLYLGRLRRAIIAWLLAVAVMLGVFVIIAMPSGGWLSPYVMFAVVLAIPFGYAIDAVLITPRCRNRTRKWYQQWWLYIIAPFVFVVCNITVAMLNRVFFVEAFVVPTQTMAPMVEPGDRILVDKLWSSPAGLQRGDVAVFYAELPWSGGPMTYLKRVIALPGETVEIRDEVVYINGQTIDDPHKHVDESAQLSGPASFGPMTVPEEHFFVLGDQRRISVDSRHERLGPVPFGDFQGIARVIYWSRREIILPNYRLRQPQREISREYRWDRVGNRLD